MASRLHESLTQRRLSRRAFVGATAATMALPALMQLQQAAAAGSKEFHIAWPYDPPPKGHFNLVSGVTNGIMLPPNIYADMIIQPPAMYYWGTGQWLPLMATEWSFKNGDTFTMTLRKGAKWSDGKDFTAKDVLTTFWVSWIMRLQLFTFVDKIEAPDDYTVNFHMSKPSSQVQRYVLRTNIVSDATYGDWAKKAETLFNSGKTMDDPEGKQLTAQFTQFRPPDVISSGPFKFDVNSITQAQMNLVRNESAWNADQVAFDKLVNFNGETPVITPIVLAKQVDYATQGFPVASEKQFQNEGIRIVRPPVYSGPAIFMNYGKLGKVFNDKRVRQAMAMAINRQQNGTVALGKSGIAVKYMTGMSDNFVPQWISEADTATLNQYAYDPEKAASLLQAAGWKKGGDGIWQAADGTKAEFDLEFPAEYADWSASGQDAADQLNKFGFKISPRAVTYTQQPVDVDKGNFQLAIQAWGSSSNPHPFFSFVQDLYTHNYIIAPNNGGRGMDFPLQQTGPDGKPVDLKALVDNSAVGLDDAAQKAAVTTISKVFNDLLPIVPLYERYGNNTVLENVRAKPWPPDSDPIYKNSPYADGIVTMLMLTGKLQPV